jgi:soluble lytic murein transglycosylase-like protein
VKKLIMAMLAVGLLALGGQAATSGTSVKAGTTTYTVRSGDTLSGIASKFGTTPGAIAKANKIKNANLIVIGRKLTIPTGAAAASPAGLPAKLVAHPDRVALRPTFEKWAAHYGVPADVLEATCWVESGWQSGVVSITGAVGIGQLQPATVDHVRLLIGISTLDPYNPDDNIRMSARFLKFLLDRTGGDVGTALAAYYQGLRSVTTSPILGETKQYVATVQAYRPFFS